MAKKKTKSHPIVQPMARVPGDLNSSNSYLDNVGNVVDSSVVSRTKDGTPGVYEITYANGTKQYEVAPSFVGKDGYNWMAKVPQGSTLNSRQEWIGDSGGTYDVPMSYTVADPSQIQYEKYMPDGLESTWSILAKLGAAGLGAFGAAGAFNGLLGGAEGVLGEGMSIPGAFGEMSTSSGWMNGLDGLSPALESAMASEAGLSTQLYRLADSIGVSPNTVSNVLNGVSSGNPAIDSAIKSAGGSLMGSLNWGNVIGAGMGLLDSGDKEMTSTSKSAPWKPMQPYILDAAERVSKSLPENPSAEQMAIYNAYMNSVGGLQNLGMQANQGYFDPILERVNDISDPSNPNPYIDGVAQAIAQKSNRNLMENIMPGIRSGAVANGYGSSRQGIAEGLAMRDTQNQINESIAPLYMQGYENWQNRMMQADQFNANLGLNRNNQNISASQIALNNRMQPMQTAYNALLGGFGMADNMNNYDFNQAQRYAGTMASLGGLGGQQTTSQPLYQNTMGNVLGGAMLGGKLWG